jgi:integrase
LQTASPPKPVRRVVRKRLADGTVKTYVYDRPPVPRGRALAAPTDSLKALLIAYERSPEWTRLKPRTRKQRLIAFRHLRDIEHLAVPGIKRRDVLALRDAIAAGHGPGAANSFAASFATLMSWARDRGWIEHSPADRIKALPGGHFPAWSEDDLTLALDNVPEPIRRALVLAVHTGQRRGDLIALRWRDIAGGAIRLRQEKTGKALAVPLHPDLAAELATWREGASAETILTTATGLAWKRDHLTMVVMRALREIGLAGLNLHGLRKLAATRLAEAGCSASEIASITGHSSLAQVALYTAAADQERLARAAMNRLQTKPRVIPKTGT